ncbi:hypothetical protein CURTO8I2_160018 [Curtobacterium sp. 8I-2]|nr:hypothetical protein CURTO8I2_160018 [Curtobacterium sp. 8I-2]
MGDRSTAPGVGRAPHPDRCRDRHLRRLGDRRRHAGHRRGERRRRLRDVHDLPLQHRRRLRLPAARARPRPQPARLRRLRGHRRERHVVRRRHRDRLRSPGDRHRGRREAGAHPDDHPDRHRAGRTGGPPRLPRATRPRLGVGPRIPRVPLGAVVPDRVPRGGAAPDGRGPARVRGTGVRDRSLVPHHGGARRDRLLDGLRGAATCRVPSDAARHRALGPGGGDEPRRAGGVRAAVGACPSRTHRLSLHRNSMVSMIDRGSSHDHTRLRTAPRAELLLGLRRFVRHRHRVRRLAVRRTARPVDHLGHGGGADPDA